MKHIKTGTGFECDVNENVLDDVELLEYLAAIAGGDVILYPRLLKKLLSEDAKAELYDHVRTEDGRVPHEAFDAEIRDIFSAIKGGKN